MARFEFDDHSWVQFAESTVGRGPLEYFHSAIEFTDGNRGAARLAIDLGFGGGVDARGFLARGWRVFAVDAEPEAGRLLEEWTPPQHRDRLEIAIGRFHEIELPEADLVYAQFSLPFAGEYFEAAVTNALSAVVSGGAFVGQFFAVGDSWADDPNVAVVDLEWAESMFAEFSDVHIEERDRLGASGTGDGTKRWHFFHVVARR